MELQATEDLCSMHSGRAHITLKSVLCCYNIWASPEAFARRQQIFVLHAGVARIQKQTFLKSSLYDNNEPVVETLGIIGKGWVKEETMMGTWLHCS